MSTMSSISTISSSSKASNLRTMCFNPSRLSDWELRGSEWVCSIIPEHYEIPKYFEFKCRPCSSHSEEDEYQDDCPAVPKRSSYPHLSTFIYLMRYSAALAGYFITEEEGMTALRRVLPVFDVCPCACCGHE